jgi:hypothetical protein
MGDQLHGTARGWRERAGRRLRRGYSMAVQARGRGFADALGLSSGAGWYGFRGIQVWAKMVDVYVEHADGYLLGAVIM